MHPKCEFVKRLLFLGVWLLLALYISSRDANAQESIMVEGQITSKDSYGNEKPVSQYPVLVTPSEGSKSKPAGTVTDPNGKFRLFLSPGKYHVVLPEDQMIKKEIEVKRGDAVIKIEPFRITTEQQG